MATKSAEEYISILSLDDDDLEDVEEELENAKTGWKGTVNWTFSYSFHFRFLMHLIALHFTYR